MPQRTYVVLPSDLFPDQVQITKLNSSLSSSFWDEISSNYRYVIILFVICCHTSLTCWSPCNFVYLRSFSMSDCWKFTGSLWHLLTSGSRLCSSRLSLKLLFDRDHLLEFKANCFTVIYLISILWISQSY